MNADSSPSPATDTSAGEPIDVLAYLWSLRRYIPVGLIVMAAVTAAMILPNRDSGSELAAVSVQTTLLVEVPSGAAAGSNGDAAAAASTYAALAQAPGVLGSVDVPGADTPEQLRLRTEVYSAGATIIIKVNGLPREDGLQVVAAVGERVAALPQTAPLTVAGEVAQLQVAREPFELVGSGVTRSAIQSYILAAVTGGAAGLAVMAALGYRARRRSR